ncbi:MAG: carboxypeptidase-like regulatory domain-containing protein [Trueperaceae bacterium]
MIRFLPLCFIFVLFAAAFAQQGVLQEGDLQLDSGEYADLHELEVTGAGVRLIVELASDEFDPYLIILDPEGTNLLEVDDSEGEGLQVKESLEIGTAGTYTAVVTSAFPGETGAYTLVLRVEQLNPLAAAVGDKNAASKAADVGAEADERGFDLPDLEAPTPGAMSDRTNTVSLQSQIAPQAGYISGTTFDPQGRPLAGAGVLIYGTTYTQGQRTEFETVSGPNGTFSVRVPDGRYQAKAWIDREMAGRFFSRVLHPVSGNPGTEVDSLIGGNLDFQWRLSGLSANSTPPGTSASDFYGAAIDFSYCGLPATAYCTMDDDGVPTTPIAPGGSTVTVTLEPTGSLIDGSQGEEQTFRFLMMEQDLEYPYEEGIVPGYPGGGGGRLKLDSNWQYHSESLFDIPLGSYRMTATVTLPDGRSQPLRLGLADDDVNYGSVPVSFVPWEGHDGRSYIGGGITELRVYVRD